MSRLRPTDTTRPSVKPKPAGVELPDPKKVNAAPLPSLEGVRDLLLGKAVPGPLDLDGTRPALVSGKEERALPKSAASELRALAKELSAKGVAGVELMSTVAGAAVARYADDPYRSSTDKMDAVMRDLAAVFLGGSAQWLLEDFSKVATLKGLVDHPSQPLVHRFQRELGKLDASTLANQKWEDNLDPTAGLDFKEGFRDGSRNQVFHTFAFVFIQYFGDSKLISRVANAKHELWDAGTSQQDFQASHTGIVLGKWLRDLRDDPSSGGKQLRSVPAVLGAALAKGGAGFGDAGRPWNRGEDFSAVSGTVNRRFEAFLQHPGAVVELMGFLADNLSREKVSLQLGKLGAATREVAQKLTAALLHPF